jgi:hypothetical protein
VEGGARAGVDSDAEVKVIGQGSLTQTQRERHTHGEGEEEEEEEEGMGEGGVGWEIEKAGSGWLSFWWHFREGLGGSMNSGLVIGIMLVEGGMVEVGVYYLSRLGSCLPMSLYPTPSHIPVPVLC